MRLWLGIVVVLGVAAQCAGGAGGALPRLLLPDLDQRPPLAVSTRWGGSAADPRVLLAFASSVENVGYGPAIVVGRRASTRVPTMRADQVIRLRSGGLLRIKGVGRLRYNVNPSHSHWHLLPFEQYELRTLGGKRIVRDQKSGFCLTSDHRSPLPTLGPRGTHPVDRSDCARDKPRARGVVEGIAVGWGDLYIPAREGQYVDLTGVPPGNYDLVHRVNVGRLLREANYANNASSLRIRLLPQPTPNDLPPVQVLKTCETGTHC
jgi:Lysyl oxidase